MYKLIGINLIIDAIILFLIFYYEIKNDGDAPFKALFALWALWIILFGFISTGIFLLFI